MGSGSNHSGDISAYFICSTNKSTYYWNSSLSQGRLWLCSCVPPGPFSSTPASSARLSCLISSRAREPQLEIRGTEERGTYSHGVLPTGSSWASHINCQNYSQLVLHGQLEIAHFCVQDFCVLVPWALQAATAARLVPSFLLQEVGLYTPTTSPTLPLSVSCVPCWGPTSKWQFKILRFSQVLGLRSTTNP